DQIQQRIGRTNESASRGLFDAEVLKELALFVRIELRDFHLDLSRDRDQTQFLGLCKLENLAAGISARLGLIQQQKQRLETQESKPGDETHILVSQLQITQRTFFLKRSLQAKHQIIFSRRVLFFLQTIYSILDLYQIGQHQLIIKRANVSSRIGRLRKHRIIKCANDVNQRVGLAHVLHKLWIETGMCLCAVFGLRASDVHKADLGK